MGEWKRAWRGYLSRSGEIRRPAPPDAQVGQIIVRKDPRVRWEEWCFVMGTSWQTGEIRECAACGRKMVEAYDPASGKRWLIDRKWRVYVIDEHGGLRMVKPALGAIDHGAVCPGVRRSSLGWQRKGLMRKLRRIARAWFSKPLQVHALDVLLRPWLTTTREAEADGGQSDAVDSSADRGGERDGESVRPAVHGGAAGRSDSGPA